MKLLIIPLILFLTISLNAQTIINGVPWYDQNGNPVNAHGAGIIRDNDIKSVTIVRMEVPCCGGLQRAAENALRASGKFIPWQVVTVSRDGRILE